MVTQRIQTAVLATVLTIGGPVLGLAQSSQMKGDTYTWNGELVSLDTTAKTMTVKSRVAYQEAISELTHFKAGDRVWIVWSGLHDSSDAVRQIRRAEAGRKIDENMVLPAELVSTETPNQYLTIRIKVPESGQTVRGEHDHRVITISESLPDALGPVARVSQHALREQ
jgi:hypothetical protein